MFRKIILLTILINAVMNVSAQNIITDRPDQTESAAVVQVKSFQLESGLLLGYSGKNSTAQQQLIIPTALLRYGLTKNIELRLVEQLENVKITETSANTFGLSDIELGAKIHLFTCKRKTTDIAFLSHLVIPSGSSGIGGETFGSVNKIAFAHTISDFLGAGFNVGYDYFGTGKGDFTYSFVLGAGLGDKLSIFAETYGENVEFENWFSNFDTGITYLVNRNFQLDASFGIGLNHTMKYFSTGFSWNIKNSR